MMNAWATLIVGLGLPAAEPDGGYTLAPKYLVGQEIVYSGSMVERYTGKQGARYEQPYDLEASMLVAHIDAHRNFEIGCYTVARMPNRDGDIEVKAFEDVSSFHFDQIKVSSRGAAAWAAGSMKGGNVMLPADGLAPWELGFLLETPDEPVSQGGTWTIQRSGQPSTQCSVAGRDSVDGEPCIKILCMQQSPTWSYKTINQITWRNSSTVWISQKHGFVYKVVRSYQVREPGDEQPSKEITVQYTQASNLVFHGPEFQERTADLEAAAKAQMEFEKVTSGASERTPRNHLAAIKHQINFSLEKPSATPYRAAMVEMARMVEEAEKNAGATPHRPSPPLTTQMAAVVGRKARQLAFLDVEKKENVSLKSLKGRAALIVYVDPSSPLSIRALDAVVHAAQTPKTSAEIYVVCTKVEPEAVERMRHHVSGAYHVCKAQAIDRGYGATAMPHTILIDAEGILRLNFSGFGPELAAGVAQDVAKHGDPADKLGAKEDKRPSYLR